MRANLGGVRLCELALSLRDVSARELREQDSVIVQRLGAELARLDAALIDLDTIWPRGALGANSWRLPTRGVSASRKACQRCQFRGKAERAHEPGWSRAARDRRGRAGAGSGGRRAAARRRR